MVIPSAEDVHPLEEAESGQNFRNMVLKGKDVTWSQIRGSHYKDEHKKNYGGPLADKSDARPWKDLATIQSTPEGRENVFREFKHGLGSGHRKINILLLKYI